MLMRTNTVSANTISYKDKDLNEYSYESLTNVDGILYVTSTLSDGAVVESSISVDIVNSAQESYDNQNWDSLKKAINAKNLYNFGLGGDRVAEKVITTSYPYPDGDGYTTSLPNEVRWMVRRYNEGSVECPDCIVIWLGTNGGGEPSTDNYDTVMEMTYEDLSSNYSVRKTFYGGLRWSLETLYRNFMYATICIVSPVQTNPANYRTYEKLSTTTNALKRMASRYSCIFFDALNEICVVDFYENDLKDGTGYFLTDGLHPNARGKVVWTNYLSSRLSNMYFSKKQ